MKKYLQSSSPEATEAIGQAIGAKLRGGEVIELKSDLGGGKTTFVRGLAEGFGSGDRVASPTFTVSKVYQADGRQLVHFDFYRLNEPGLVAHELADHVGDDKTSLVVEWADKVRDVLPDDRLTIEIVPTGDQARELVIDYTESLAYLMEGNR